MSWPHILLEGGGRISIPLEGWRWSPNPSQELVMQYLEGAGHISIPLWGWRWCPDPSHEVVMQYMIQIYIHKYVCTRISSYIYMYSNIYIFYTVCYVSCALYQYMNYQHLAYSVKCITYTYTHIYIERYIVRAFSFWQGGGGGPISTAKVDVASPSLLRESRLHAHVI